MIPLTLVGGGRMARAIIGVVAEDPEFSIQGVLVRKEPESPLPGSPPVHRDPAAFFTGAPRTVVLDFSSADGFQDRVAAVAGAGHPLVQGTTGLPDTQARVLEDAAKRIPVVTAPNTSLGVAVLRRALRTVAGARGTTWNLSILDRHHRHKKDAPSGTARLLGEELQELSGTAPEIASFRHGGVAGEHSIYAVGEEEELVFTHRAFSRAVFARGAVAAAVFAWNADAGLYTMEDVLG